MISVSGYDLTELQAWARTQRQQELDDILSRWHWWRAGYRSVRGFNDRATVTGDYQTSRQYDDANGALDGQIENSIMAQVEFQFTEMSRLHQVAIMVNARAVYTGADVWLHPSMPTDMGARRRLIDEARTRLMQRLVACGVMEAE